ncbi:putative CtpA-like serine protease [Planctomycetes bacterium Pan216]|uniref:Putative CtpA-like serine protease n=1 Tax=Kolteria novifilia TaxID=2527975 RepID=A0A518BAG8_9BACT|nr:putative CtpA-like serine protease [Planctomycetes bacterium Pan216]
MRFTLRLGWTLVLCVAAFLPTTARAQATSSLTAPHVKLDELLKRATSYESRHLWQQAADVYERAIRFYPDETSLRSRWRKAEQLYSLSRRYHDISYREELLTLGRERSLDLYREILSKVKSHYVDEVDLGDLVELGYTNLRVALAQPIFVEANFREGQRDNAKRLIEEFSRKRPLNIHSLDDAVAEVRAVSDRCRMWGMNRPVSVVMEFVSAASEGLDPYSAHLTPNRLRDLYAMIDGNFVGLGIEVKGCDEGLRIVSVLADSPAEEAGLKDGDTILVVDDERLAGRSAEEAANFLQGPKGSRVRLSVRDGAGQRRDLLVARREVIVHSVTNITMLDRQSGVGYVRLVSFQKLTATELDKAIADLRQSGMRSLVLDLRGNPGGLLDVAVSVANRFIDRGTLVTTRGRAWGQSWSHRARPGKTWDFPLVILIDGDSASASEILAGAIKDHQRGTIVGTRSYGKGSVQSIFPLRTVPTGLRLTTARFYSPQGEAFEQVGVDPDRIVYRDNDQLGDQIPVPREPTLTADAQLRAAHSLLAGSLSASR